ncbi:MAG: LamG domain-containing protein [Candidatus Bathyarchaeia archaeon]|jgi:hypothetical protein
MKSKLTLTKRKRLVLATVVICAVLIAGLAILWQGGKVSEAAVLDAHPGLVGWWRFDETSGAVASDNTTNGNNGILQGSPPPSWVTGKYGNALQFDGSHNYVQIPDSASLKPANITITAWINPTSVTGDTIYSKNYPICTLRYCQNTPSNPYPTFILTISGTQYEIVSSIAITYGAWNYIAATFDGTTMNLYVNGQLAATATHSGSIGWDTTVATIAENTWGGYGAGIIDEVQIYNRALSATEIQADYQQSPDFSSNLLAALPKGTTDFIATLSWQGIGSINVTIQSPSQTYTEDTLSVYQKTSYSVSGGTSTMLNIKRLEVSIGALGSDQNWHIILQTSNVTDYKITVEVQK